MLTGHHPFNRIDAAKAREARLVAERPGMLSRQQWQALQHALAFERDARTASVKDFLAEFAAPGPQPQALAARRRRRRGPRADRGAAVLRSQSGSQAQAQALIAQLRESDPKVFAAALVSLQHAPDALRRRALADEQARSSVIGHYESDVHTAEAPPALDFARARALLGELKALLPDSEEVANLQAKLQADAQSALAAQLPLLAAALAQGLLLPRRAPITCWTCCSVSGTSIRPPPR